MAPLERAVALVQMKGAALAVGQDLDFDVAGCLDIFFDQHPRIAEGALGFTLRSRQRLFKFGMLVDPPHAAAAAAGHGLDQHGVSDFVGLALEEGGALLLAVVARDNRNARFFHQRLGPVLETHGTDRGGRRTDKDGAGRGAGFRELGLFRNKSIAGMHALGTTGLSRGDQPVDRKIAVPRRRRADEDGFVAAPDMERAGIGFGIDSDGAHSKPLGRPRDPDCDLTAIGDQNRREHLRSPIA